MALAAIFIDGFPRVDFLVFWGKISVNQNPRTHADKATVDILLSQAIFFITWVKYYYMKMKRSKICI